KPLESERFFSYIKGIKSASTFRFGVHHEDINYLISRDGIPNSPVLAVLLSCRLSIKFLFNIIETTAIKKKIYFSFGNILHNKTNLRYQLLKVLDYFRQP
ncbi:hypothetical protein C0J52_22904, partial [Blattella germanica]